MSFPLIFGILAFIFDSYASVTSEIRRSCPTLTKIGLPKGLVQGQLVEPMSQSCGDGVEHAA